MPVTTKQCDFSQPVGENPPQLKTGVDKGCILGRSGDKIGFLGRTPIAQRERIFVPLGQIHTTGSKVGATSTGAGWISGAAADIHAITLAASATATATFPISGLRVGDKITGFGPIGQIESGGNTATLDANLRSLTVAAADPTDASLASITQISVTADAIVSFASHGVKDLDITVTRNKTYYVLLTGVTAAATDIALQGIYVEVVRNRAHEAYRVFNSRAKIGADSGWSVTTAANTHTVGTLAASDAAASLVIPLSGIQPGTLIRSVAVLGQIEMGSTAATTLAGALYKIAPAAGANVTTLVKNLPTIVGAASTDVALDATNMGWAAVGDADDVLTAAGEHYFVLLNATTVANSDIQIMGVEALVREPVSMATRMATNMKKLGSSAGWSANPAANTDESTCPISQTAAELVIPLTGLRIGDRITSFWPVGQVVSVAACTVDVSLRKITGAAADLVDASVAAITQVSTAVNLELGTAHAKTGLSSEVVGADETFYFLITATTDGDATIGLIGVGFTVEPDPTEAIIDTLAKFGLVAAS